MIINTSEQGSPEWLQERAGVVTASMFKVARERLKKTGELTDAAKSYAFRVALESLSGQPLDEGFETWAMRRGKELEPEGRAMYELKTGNLVTPAGFVTTDCRTYGASADGFIGDDGGLEIKCLVSSDSIRKALFDSTITEWYDQIQGGMWITDRGWWDFVVYCPQLATIGKELTVQRIERDQAYIDGLMADLASFQVVVDQYKRKIEEHAQ